MTNEFITNSNFTLLKETVSLLNELKFDKHHEAIDRIVSNKVEFKTIVNNDGVELYCIGAKGVQNTYGKTAEDNALKTIDYIKDLIIHLGYTKPVEYNSFKINKEIPALKNMCIILVEKTIYEKLLVLKEINNFLDQFLKPSTVS